MQVDAGIARIVLNRPDQLNAISPTLLEDLERVCGAIEHDGAVRVGTLTGAGRAFCAGADLRAVRELSPDARNGAASCGSGIVSSTASRRSLCPSSPASTASRSPAASSSMLLADLVVADESARLGDQHANFGLVAGGGGSQRLPRLVGARRAKELMLLGGWLSAPQALEWGLVNRVAPAGTLDVVVEELAAALADKSGSASRTVKALVNRGLDMDLGRGLELELELVADHMRSPDAAEGLRAFAEKRAPVFRPA